MKHSRYSPFQKLMSFVIALVLVLGLLPAVSMSANAAQSDELIVTDKVADPHTLNNWQDYYGDNSILPDGTRGISTWKAGGVWTDKSVFSDAESFAAAAGDAPALTVGENNFLVSLSALASNTEVVGQSSAPTDTILVLDLSNSMDTSRSVPTMVEAANDAIDALLEMNSNNRVGVVLYSGNTSTNQAAQTGSATVLLALDRYSAASDGTYLTCTVTTSSNNGGGGNGGNGGGGGNNNNSYDTTVSVTSGVKNSAGTAVSGSKNTNGGTYIQNGLYKAYEQFQSVSDVVVQEGTQAGTQRQPIMVLMSDGAPTVATTSYNAVGSSNQGNGSATNDRIAFLTQLTAAWVKGKVTAKYNDTAMKFYTLGLGTGNSEQATSVLYPSGSNDTVKGYWNTYLSAASGNNVTVGSNNNRITVTRDSAVTAMNYVDRYWQADDADGMVGAFKEIIGTIELQTAYSATLVESGNADLDGYITVEDELGSMMQVKDIKGILLGETLFTGSEMAQALNSMGTVEDPTATGDEFVRTVMERIGTADTSATQQLISAAYAAGQLSYTSDTEYSNYIGWYGDADNNFLGFWQESDGWDGVGAPAGAVYINRSYGYLGRSHEESDADMMHIVVMLHTEIATGDQIVLFKVPASLIPMISYRVEMTDDDCTLTVEETDPIRLLYEVGLPDDVNSVNLEQKVAEYLAKDATNHIHRDEDGNYIFYANGWAADENEQAPVISQLTDTQKQALTEKVAESHFIPNTLNERFYIQEDSVVYTKNADGSYSPVTSQPVAGGEYYFVRQIVTVTGEDGAAEVTDQYELLYAATVANASNFQYDAQTQNWEVKAGTIRQSLSNLGLEKTDNSTGTISDSDHLWVNILGADAGDYSVYSFLGNNGKLTVASAQGIKVTKNVTAYAEGDSADTLFTIVVTLDQAEDGITVTDPDGAELTDAVISVDKKTVTVYLANGETAYITGLTAGTGYTVAETNADGYTVSYTGNTGTVEAFKLKDAVVTNTPVQYGDLYITKEVVHAHDGETFPADVEFQFEVTFVDANGDPIANKTFAVENNYDETLTTLTTDIYGVMRGKLRHGETAYIQGIPEGAVVTVAEVNIPDNYTAAYRSRNATGLDADNDGVVTIIGNSNATVVVTNTYTPKSTTVDLDIAGTKNFAVDNDKTSLLTGGTFSFEVQRWTGSAWQTIRTASVAYAENEAGTKTFTMEDVLSGITYSEAGTYTYQVVEVKGNTENVTYDRTLYTFTVTVTDVNGQLTAVVTDLNNAAITDGSYEVTFTNTYNTAPISIDVKKAVVDTSENPLTSKAGFAFEAVQTDENWQPLTGDTASTLTVYSDGAGEARFTATYDKAGTYHFLVTEKAGTAANWSYSKASYKVTIVVTADETTGDLTAEMSVAGENLADGESAQVGTDKTSAEIIFKNTYDPEDGEVDLDAVPTVLKKLNGRKLQAGEFTFAIFENGKSSFESTDGALAVGTNDADGNVSFDNKLTFSQVGTYYYDVVEITGDQKGMSYDTTIFDMVVEVTDNGDGELVASYYFEDATTLQVTFTNTYTLQPTEAVIDGMKSIDVQSGEKFLTAGAFTFGLYEVIDGVESTTALKTTTNLANGTFAFDAITYDSDDLGKHTYVIREIAPAEAVDGVYQGITYSTQAFTVTVNVTDNGDGTMSAEVTGDGADTVKFVNTYNAKAAVPVQISGTKTLRYRDLTTGEFKFVLYKSDAAFSQHTEIVKQNGQDYVTNDADGNFTLSTGELTELGYHYYILKELIPGEDDRAAGISYDTAEYHITVNVVDVGRGQLTTLVSVYHPGTPSVTNPAVAFTNIYRPADDEYVLSGSKQYNGGKTLSAGDFSFELYEGTALVDSAAVNADGSFSFDAITYTADDIGTHTYTVKEAIPEGATENEDGTWTLGSIIYDGTEYTVVVTVADDDQDGVLEISHTVNGSAETQLAFTNTFVPTPITHTLVAEKSYNKTLKGNDFTFELTGTIGEDEISQEKKNNASGIVTFDPLSFATEGTYTFTVKEQKNLLWDFIKWDTNEYEVTIEVINTEGVLSVASVSIVNADGEESTLTFVNEYQFTDTEAEITLTGSKSITGDRTAVNELEFAFGLYDENGTRVDLDSNDEDGNFSLSAKFGVDDIAEEPYIYTVKEILPTDASGAVQNPYKGITYDETVYRVAITVSDNGEGAVEASYELLDADAVAFSNRYDITGTDTIELVGNKTITGDRVTVENEEFEFVLYDEQGEEVDSDKNAADGSFTLSATFGKDDIGTVTYTVKEVLPKDADGNEVTTQDGITYDDTVYQVEITVTDNNEGGVTATYTVSGEGSVKFENRYDITGTDKLELTGSKTVTGDRTTVGEKEFHFGLYAPDGKLVDDSYNAAGGSFSLSAEFDKDDIRTEAYAYTVKEILPTDADGKEVQKLDGITYDTTVYTVNVTVSDNGKGGVEVTYEIVDAEAITFANTYTVSGTGKLELSGTKTLTGKTMADGDFSFGLYRNDTQVAVASNVNGKFVLTEEYSAAELGEYTYQVREVKGNMEGVTYDTTVYTVDVKVYDNGKGGVAVDYAIRDAQSISFTNTYVPVAGNPKTGDSVPLVMLAVLMLASGVGIILTAETKKRRQTQQ